ncbi:MAG: head-tail connector protein [Wenzhouxiangella sp.]|nr:head-tail connector protein [Wenzhouxiangella sp.]
MELNKEVLQKFERIKKLRQPWEEDWKDITRFILPRRENWEDTANRGKKIATSVFDGTAIGAASLMANGFVGYVMSPNVPWFRLTFEDEELLQIEGVKEWLQMVEKTLYSDFRRSNIYEEAIEYFRDGGTVATATMYCEDRIDTNTLRFSTRHPKEIYIAEGEDENIDTWFRKFWMTARSLEQKFGYDNLSQAVKNLCEKNPYEHVPVIHAVFPREDRDVTKLDNKNKPFASIYVEADAEHSVLRESGYDESPYITWRWSTNSDELYGRGPGHDVLVEVKKINHMSKGLLRLTQMATDPPLNVPDEMRNRLKWEPGGRNYYSQPEMIVQPAQIGANFPVGFDREENLRQSIEQAYMVDFFLMLQRTPQQLTATEVMERQAEKAAIMGPILGRLTTDFLNPLIQKAFRLGVEAGRIQMPPEEILQQLGGQMKIEYIGPLAQAQKQFHTTHGIDHSLAALAPIAQFDPQVVDNIDFDELAREALEAHGIPQKALRKSREVEAMRQARMQAEQQAQQLDQAERLGKAPGLMKRPEPGSPMEAMNQAANQGAIPDGEAQQ